MQQTINKTPVNKSGCTHVISLPNNNDPPRYSFVKHLIFYSNQQGFRRMLKLIIRIQISY